jgi:hypothetical protein
MSKEKNTLLKFGKGNAKLSKDIYTFSLPAGHSCPFAFECKASADRSTGKIKDGKNQVFRCFAASQEALYTNTRNARWYNYDLLKGLKTVSKMTDLIVDSLPPKATTVRVHVSGDFFSQAYFDAWMAVARIYPKKKFYAYTKSIPYWLERKDTIPKNFNLTSSKGGRTDELIDLNKLKYAEVVFTEEDAKELKLELDHDDSHAYNGKKSFGLLIHGSQRKGSSASVALSNLKKKGIKGYSKKQKV